MAKNRSPKQRIKRARKYRVALTEAQIKRAIVLADKAIQDGDNTKTTESLRYNLNYVYEKILESELSSRDSRKLLEYKINSEPHIGNSTAVPTTDNTDIGDMIHTEIQKYMAQLETPSLSPITPYDDVDSYGIS